MHYVCEDCKAAGHSAKGDNNAIRRFYALHEGHNVHFGDFGEPGGSVERYLINANSEMKWDERKKRFLNFLGLSKSDNQPWQKSNR